MGNTLTFTVPGAPVPKARPRVTRHGTYTPAKTKDYEAKVAILAKKAMLEQGFKLTRDAVELRIDFYLPRPQSHYGTGRNKAIIKDQYKDIYHITKPDLDNLIKSIKDALNKIAWKDDSQVMDIRATKDYSFGKDRCEITVITLEKP